MESTRSSMTVKVVGVLVACLGLVLAAGFVLLLGVSLAFPWYHETPYLLALAGLCTSGAARRRAPVGILACCARCLEQMATTRFLNVPVFRGGLPQGQD